MATSVAKLMAKLLLLGAITVALVPMTAQAMLDEQEAASLRRVLQIYKSSMTVGEFAKATAADLGYDRSKFLASKIQDIEGRRLPALEIRSGARVTLHAAAHAVTVDFISLRSETLAINGREIEFQPGDDQEHRWIRLVEAVRVKRTAWERLLVHDAFAASDPRSELQATQSLSMIIYSMLGASRASADCTAYTQQVRTTCDRMRSAYADAETPPAPGRVAAPKTPARGCKSSPLKLDAKEALKKKIEAILAQANQLSTGEEKDNFKDETLNRSQLKALQTADKMIVSHLVRSKTNDLTDETLQALAKYKDQKTCVTEISDCVKALYAGIASQTEDPELACYVTEAKRKIEAAETGGGTQKPGARSTRKTE